MSDPRFPGGRSEPFYNPNEQELADLRSAVETAHEFCHRLLMRGTHQLDMGELANLCARLRGRSDAKRRLDDPDLRADLAEALDLLRACFTDREATSDERRRFDALMEKHKEKP